MLSLSRRVIFQCPIWEAGEKGVLLTTKRQLRRESQGQKGQKNGQKVLYKHINSGIERINYQLKCGKCGVGSIARGPGYVGRATNYGHLRCRRTPLIPPKSLLAIPTFGFWDDKCKICIQGSYTLGLPQFPAVV